MRKLIISVVVGGLLIFGSIYFAGLIAGSKKSRRPPAQKVVKTVFVDTVKNGIVPIVIPANGNLKAKRRVELFSEVQGVFRSGSKLFRTGQEYGTGQTLIRIDANEYYASVQSAKSNLYNLLTSIMPDLRLDYQEVYPKWQAYLNSFDLNKTTPQLPAMDTEKEKFFISGRGIIGSYYNVKNLEQRLSKYTITAPFKGVLTDALVTEGTLIRVGQKLGEYINIGVYELEVSVSKTFGDFLKVGKQVELTNLDKSQKYTGEVTRVNGRVDQNSQTITVFIEVSNGDLKEGQYLEANLEAREETNAIEVDRSLLLENNQIFVVRDSVLDLIDVKPIYFTDKKVVLKDVQDNEVIVTRVMTGAYEGMLVKVFDGTKSKKAKS
ncbi:efflux RND transporter periplasmic adaptor subunit [Flagellimonas sp. W118]|uniref:efflux RND transporter periplasmic adaptor subunit n=1 Tax=Flagellimonas sp. W118 TaxID=3410791 RepID=UPI003BF52FE5